MIDYYKLRGESGNERMNKVINREHAEESRREIRGAGETMIEGMG